MDISQLRTLVHVAELGSLSKAAGRLRIAQPALSRQVRMLEQELGVRLFDRHGRGMVITERGRDVLAHANRIIADLNELKATAAGPDAPLTGHVGVGLPPTVADLVSVPLIAAFRSRHPAVMVRLASAFTGDILDWLLRGEIDVAILYDPRATRSLRSEPLLQENLFLIGPPDAGLSRRRAVPFRRLARAPLLLPSSRHGLRNIVEAFARDAKVELDVVVEADSYVALKELVRQGHGCTILPLAPIYDEVRAGRLSAAPITGPAPSRRVFLSYPSDRPVSRLARAAGDLLTSIMADHVRRGIWVGQMLVGPRRD